MEDVQRLARASAAPAQEALAVAFADAVGSDGGGSASAGGAPVTTSVPVVLRTRPVTLPGRPDLS